MDKRSATDDKLLLMTGRYILMIHPYIIAVVFMELDCKCVKLAGVNVDGSTVLPLTLVRSQTAQQHRHPPRCHTCIQDNGLDLSRLVRHGVIWILQKRGKPDKTLRNFIIRRLFGRGGKTAESIMLAGVP